MAREFSPQIISANDLLTGDVVYLAQGARWTRTLASAVIAQTQDEVAELQVLADQPRVVVGPYPVAVDLDAAGAPHPTHFRERFREYGPSNRRDLGRQADFALQGEI